MANPLLQDSEWQSEVARCPRGPMTLKGRIQRAMAARAKNYGTLTDGERQAWRAGFTTGCRWALAWPEDLPLAHERAASKPAPTPYADPRYPGRRIR